MKNNLSVRSRAMVIVSGGLDSTVATAMAVNKYSVERGMFFHYGQRALDRERLAAGRIAEHYGFEIIDTEISWLGKISSSSIIGKNDLPGVNNVLETFSPAGSKSYGAGKLPDRSSASVRLPATSPSHETGSGSVSANEGGGSDIKDLSGEVGQQLEIDSLCVENRNGIFLNIAAAFAIAGGEEVIIVGFNRDEAEDFPDNGVDYVKVVNESLRIGTGEKVRVESPTISMSKRQIVEMGLELSVPWELIWSCYGGGSEMCGKCNSCLRLKGALAGTEAMGRVSFEGEDNE